MSFVRGGKRDVHIAAPFFFLNRIRKLDDNCTSLQSCLIQHCWWRHATSSTFLHKTRLDRPFVLSPLHSLHTSGERMLPQRARKAIVDSPKKVASLIDLANLPSTLREFLGQSQISRLGCFIKVWSYIKTHNLQDSNNRNMVICDDKLKSILLGKPQVELAELPMLIKLHFPKVSK